MKVLYFERWCDNDSQTEFAVHCEDKIYLAWVFYGIGAEFAKEKIDKKDIYLLPYIPYYHQYEKPKKTYTHNGATDVGRWIAKRIMKKILYIKSKT